MWFVCNEHEVPRVTFRVEWFPLDRQVSTVIRSSVRIAQTFAIISDFSDSFSIYFEVCAPKFGKMRARRCEEVHDVFIIVSQRGISEETLVEEVEHLCRMGCILNYGTLKLSIAKKLLRILEIFNKLPCNGRRVPTAPKIAGLLCLKV